MRNLVIVFLLLAASLFAQDQPRSRRPRMAKGSSKDNAAITALLNGMVKTWNAGDAAAYSNGFADEMDFIDAAGTVYKTRDEFQQQLTKLFRSAYKGAHADMQIRRLYFVRPRVATCDMDVAITRYHAVPPGLSARNGQPLRIRVKYVLSSEPRAWLIVSGQETQIRGTANK